MIRCPTCGSLLFRRRFGGIEVDGCPGCGGSFYDRGELDALVAQPATLREVDRHFVPGLQPTLAAIRSDACPRCDHALIRSSSPSPGGAIEPRGCPSCDGAWLDHGEPTAIADHLAPETRAEAAPTPPDSPTATRISALLGHGPDSAARIAGSPAGVALPLSAPLSPDPTSTAGLPVVRGRRLAGPVEEGGFLGGLSRGFRFFGTAFSLAVERPSLLVPVLCGALVQAALLGIVVVWGLTVLGRTYAVSAVPGGEPVAAWLSANGAYLLPLLLLLFFVGHVVNLVVLGATVSMIDAYLKGLEPRFGVAIRDVGKNLGAIFALAAIGTMVDMVAGAIRGAGNRRGPAGMILRPLARTIAGLIESAWTVVGFLLLPVILIEDVGLGPALARVRAIHRGSLLPVAVGEVGLRALSGFASLGLALLLILVGLGFWPPSMAEIRGLLIIALLAGSCLGAIFAYLRGAYYTCLYLWAVETERAGEPALAVVPAPLAEALAWE